MNKKLLLMAVAATAATAVHAQHVMYNHDSPKQNQVTIMETNAGAFSPDLYYFVLYNKYKESAMAENKLSFHTFASISLYSQVDEAEAIDSASAKRAKVEVLNVADRQAGIAWLVKGDKVSRQMGRFRRNIDRILLSGGIPADKEQQTEYYHVYQYAVNATKDVYMPNAQRKKECPRIYEDVTRQNEVLVSYFAKHQNITATSTLLNATDNHILHKGGIVRNAMSRWRESRLAIRDL